MRFISPDIFGSDLLFSMHDLTMAIARAIHIVYHITYKVPESPVGTYVIVEIL